MGQSNGMRETQDSDPGNWDCLHTRVCSCRKGMDTLTKHWLAYEFTENISSTNSHCTYLISGSLLETSLPLGVDELVLPSGPPSGPTDDHVPCWLLGPLILLGSIDNSTT